ncbi:MAG: hypothetical protein ACK4RV_18575 [Caulobacter sp.]
MRLPTSRPLALAVVGLAALTLAACDGREFSRKAEAPADCCCKPVCKEAPAETAEAGDGKGSAHGETGRAAGAAAAGAAASTRAEEAATPPVRYRTAERRTVRKASARRDSYAGGYRRSGTEGVGYLDEGEYAGGYRRSGGAYVRTEVSVEERETRSERRRYSETGYGYSGRSEYREGYGRRESYGYDDDRGRRGKKKRRDHDRSYVGLDRDGYLTWPGKTP